MITPSQMRAARQLLRVSQEDIAKATGLSIPTIRRAESERDVWISEASIQAIEEALVAMGAEFQSSAKWLGVRVALTKA